MELLFNGTATTSSACWVAFFGGAFHVATNQGSWTNPSGLSNSQCSLDPATSSVSFVGNTATMTVNIHFFENVFSGLKFAYTYASDTTSLNTWFIFNVFRGSWTVAAPVAVNVTPFSSAFVLVGHPQAFTAAVTGAANATVTWSLPGRGTEAGSLVECSGRHR
jgi:hypothetical protein